MLIPCNMLRSGEDVFLDDLTVEDVRQALKTEVVVVDEPGADLVNCLIEAPDHKKIRRRQIYEQTDRSDSGRPNVGKSTLFNALAGEEIIYCKGYAWRNQRPYLCGLTWLNMNFTLVDTGGIEPDSRDIILSQMREQAQIAIDTADVIIFIVDVRQGLQDSDSKVADMLRKSGKPVVLAVNKVDSIQKFGNDVYEFYNLGIGDPIPVSAASRLGIGDLLDEVVQPFYRWNITKKKTMTGRR